jgi:hypothetical protein
MCTTEAATSEGVGDGRVAKSFPTNLRTCGEDRSVVISVPRVMPGSISDTRSPRPATSWRGLSQKAPTPSLVARPAIWTCWPPCLSSGALSGRLAALP